MGRKQPPSKLITTPLPRRMEFAGGSSGALDPTAQPLPPSSLEQWFSDEAAVARFSQPVRPRQA